MAYRHYTDDDGREGVEDTKMILRGEDKRVYLTPDEYDSGSEAQRYLALSRKPTGYFEIPEERLLNVSGIRRVEGHAGQPGGGREVYVEHPIDASGLTWEEIGP